MTAFAKRLILFFGGLGLSVFIQAQFYNGLQMTFGKNRVQYNDFVWSYCRYPKYDVYFNEEGKNLADYVADYADNEIQRLESFFDYTLEKRIQFVVYNRLSDFRQSNIDLVTGNDNYNIGGTTNISRNKAFLYFEGNFDEFDEQITGIIAKVILNEMLYGNNLVDNVSNSTLMSIPTWYTDGLIDYISRKWDEKTENRVKDGIMSKKYDKFNRLTGVDATYAGHSFWKYVADTYGESVIPSIIYLTRINKSAKTGFSNVLGMSIKNLSYDWIGYYTNMFSDDASKSKVPETGNLLKKTKKHVVYQHLKISPSGNYVCYATNDMGLYKIWLLNAKTGKKTKIFKRGYRLEQITDYSYPVIAWHPGGRYVAFITEEKGGLKLYYYNIANKELAVRNFLYFEKVLDFSFSDDGSKFVFTGVKNGRVDIYVYDIASSTTQQITNDLADDSNPRFISNSTQIIFSSNRISDTLSSEVNQTKRALTNDLFIYDYKNHSDVLMRLNDGKYVNKNYPIEISHNKFIQLNDKSGDINRYISDFDSAISFIDTIVHYRYYARTAPLTDYSRNILEQDYNTATGNVDEIMFSDGRYHLFENPLDETTLDPKDIIVTSSRKSRLKYLAETDSLRNIKKNIIPINQVVDNTVIANKDTLVLGDDKIDINKYVFEIEKVNMFNEKLKDKNIEITTDTVKRRRPKIIVYRPVFYQNNMVAQVDFNFLNNTYQPFTGGAFYFNPGFNVLFKLGAYDLFEDLKITGGFRLSPDFDANEYLLSFEYLKKRLDKQLVFHRQAILNTGYTNEFGYFDIKTHTTELSLILRYPFNQVKAFATTFTYRNDRTVYLSNGDPRLLDVPDAYKDFFGLKFEYIFDNTRSLGINLYSGTRYKIFSEFYEQVDKGLTDMVVFGADFRRYTIVHRSLIWANRIAWSSSQGQSRIIYYLGGVDNWYNFNPSRVPTFEPFTETPIDTKQNYVFQAVATNMRGFPQNELNGNNFMLFNSELRLPIFRYLANYPLSSSFFENFQIVGFFDAGSAWSGATPWSGHNAYENYVINQGEYITITVASNKDPVVAGYGFGIHTQLLGYFVRFDWAWGIKNKQIQPRMFYFSTSLDF